MQNGYVTEVIHTLGVVGPQFWHSGWGHLLTKAFTPRIRIQVNRDGYEQVATHSWLAEREAGNGYTDQGNGVVCQIESIGNEWFHLIGVIDKESEMKVADLFEWTAPCSAPMADSSYVSDQEGMLVFGREDPYINLPSGPQYLLASWMIWAFGIALSSEEIQGLFDGIPPTVGVRMRMLATSILCFA